MYVLSRLISAENSNIKIGKKVWYLQSFLKTGTPFTVRFTNIPYYGISLFFPKYLIYKTMHILFNYGTVEWKKLICQQKTENDENVFIKY